MKSDKKKLKTTLNERTNRENMYLSFFFFFCDSLLIFWIFDNLIKILLYFNILILPILRQILTLSPIHVLYILLCCHSQAYMCSLSEWIYVNVLCPSQCTYSHTCIFYGWVIMKRYDDIEKSTVSAVVAYCRHRHV